eukprot:TRINITY_DN5370_c0_g1_i1.p1 TRINITY_DN5370_c0_g1~~TRINITY_DN5370_c0_g1_i1.p1  ORF type:complete len:197 (+),score=33.67 TRINITY_DN5370_c0_g1_i1:346-936(+)
MPSDEDIIAAKVNRTGILELKFTYKHVPFNLIDVGGQVSDMRKWIHSFSDASAVIFITAIEEYDRVNGEDDYLAQSIQLFHDLSTNETLRDKHFILFLNKADLFKTKVRKKPLISMPEKYPDYPDFVQRHLRRIKRDLPEEELALAYFQRKFKRRFRGTGSLHQFPICALSGEQCKKVFSSLRDGVLSKKLNTVGI